MRIEQTILLDHPADQVIAWHERPGALVRLSPPGLGSIENPAEGGLETGRRVRIRMGPPMLPDAARPLWLLRHAEHERGEGSLMFVDRQLRGPFRTWQHRHRFHPAPGGTRAEDTLDIELPRHLEPAEGIAREQVERMLQFRTEQLRDDLAFHARYREAPRLTVAIAGVSGMIGTQLAAVLETGGHTVRRMVRGREAGPGEISWDPQRGLLDPADLEGVDALVNLAGRSIGTRLTPRAKQEVMSSRVASTQLIARTLAGMADGPRTLVQASAIGYYGAQRPGERLTEDDLGGDGFLAEVTRAWEDAAGPADDAGVRVAHLRTGIVLTDAGGALLPQLPMFLAGLGGRLSRPDSVLSWITLDDTVRAYAHALLTPEVAGPVNAVGPEPATSREFARTLGRVLRRPSLVPVPQFGPKLLLGEDGAKELVQVDQRVRDAWLRASGFQPAHRELETALRHVLRR